MAIKNNSYSKKERLKSRKLINQLFQNREYVQAFPLKALYSFIEDTDTFLQAGVTVSKRSFKKATDRNNIKRLLKESYRLQKSFLESTLIKQNKKLIVFFIYTDKILPDFNGLFDKMKVILEKLEERALK